MNILGILDVGVITGALRAIGAFLCNWIYDLIAMIYQLFMTVSRLNILSSEEIGPIYQRVTMILTIVMVFYITFEFVKFVVEPDGITDKNKGVGNIVTRMIIVVVLIAFVPRIFSLAYELQNKIIENQVISKVILGKTNSEFSTFGNQFSADVLSLFYSVDEENCGNKCEDAKIVVDSNLEKLRNGSNLKLGSSINETVKQDIDGKKEEVPIIKFQGLTAIIVGGFIVYILIMYSIDVGIRYAQLIFLQIMSPIAIMGYLSPKKDNMFQKWGKQCLSTYLDLFIRISLIYFVLLIIETLGTAYNSGSLFEGLEGISGSMRVFTYIVLIMGLLAFAQRAPKLLSNLFPGLGGSGIGFGLKASDRVAPMAARALGAGLGGTSAMVRRGASRIGNEHRRRQAIKDKLLADGKQANSKSLRKALREDRKATRVAKGAYNAQKSKLKEARNELVAAQKSGDEDKISAAQEKFNQIRSLGLGKAGVSQATKDELQRAIDAKKTYEEKYEKDPTQFNFKDATAKKAYEDKLNADIQNAQIKHDKEATYSYETAKKEFETAKAKEAESKNNSFGSSIFLQAIGSAMGGMATGIKVGSGATKLSDITKKVSEANKQVVQSEMARMNYLADGGNATITSVVEKTITKLQQTVGMKTTSEIIKQEVKNIETEIKLKESQLSMEKGVKSAQDSSEDRSKKKIETKEQKIKVSTAEDVAKLNADIGNDKNGLGISIKEGQTTSEIYSMYEAAANTARSNADAANKEAIRLKMEGVPEDPDEAKKQLTKIKEAEELATELSTKAVIAENAKEQALKHLNRYGITRTLRGDIKQENGEKEDAVLTAQIGTMRQAIDNARNSQSTVEYLKTVLKPETFLAFINNNIMDFDTYDEIQGKLTGHTVQLTNENSALKETVRAINESAATAAANATSSASGGQNKK